jgi:ATP-dependent Lon protease
MMGPLVAADQRTIRLVDDTVGGTQMIAVFAQRPGGDGSKPANLYEMGTAAGIVRMLRMPDGSIQGMVQGLARVRLEEVTQSEPYLKARLEQLQDHVRDGPELEALTRSVQEQFQQVVSQSPNLPPEIGIAAMNLPDAGSLADFVAAHIGIRLEDRQEILEALDVRQRLERVTAFLTRELEVLELRGKIQSQVQTVMDKTQREFFLREQLKAIQKELGEGDEQEQDIQDIRAKLDEAHPPEEASKEAEKEIARLSRMPPQMPDYDMTRTYLDWLVNLPWSLSTEDNLDLEQAQTVLDEDHLDLEKGSKSGF